MKHLILYENLESFDTDEISMDILLDIDDDIAMRQKIDSLEYDLIKRYNARPYEIFRRVLVPHKIIRRILNDLSVNISPNIDRNSIVKVRKYIYKKLNIESKIKKKILDILDYDKYIADRVFWHNVPFIKDEYEWVDDSEELGLLD